MQDDHMQMHQPIHQMEYDSIVSNELSLTYKTKPANRIKNRVDDLDRNHRAAAAADDVNKVNQVK